MKSSKSILLILILVLISCSKNDEVENDLNNEVQIRLANTSYLKFENATFNSVNFGDIQPGESTKYVTFESSYSYGSVSVVIDGQNYGWVPIDFVGEELLQSGKYTFKYSFDNTHKVLTETLVKD